MRKRLAALLCCALLSTALSSCGQTGAYQKNRELAAAGNVTLNLTGMTASYKAMESVIASFCKLYPNCTIQYEYVQDYSESMVTRLQNNDNVDLFLTNNITADSPFLPYALELKSQSAALDLSGTYEGLIRNFSLTAGGTESLYAVPLGGEVRGMYVNKTLLASLGLQVPSNYAELTACCQKLKEAGYVPMQGNPGSFGQLLMYPYVCNLIANASDYQAAYDRVSACEPGVSELFREPVSRLYDLMANGYYNYKYVETTYGAFTDAADETAVFGFLNIASADGGTPAKADDVGRVAFMPGVMSLKGQLDKARNDYHSGIDYTFILSPVGDDGGFAYLSPAAGIAVNKNSANTAWALEFLNYLFSPAVNKAFAAERNIIPNTADALDSIRSTFSVKADHICQLGQVTFGYVFYDVIKGTLTDVSKGNNPKYMQEDGTLYPLQHYMDTLESAFAGARG